MRSSRFCERINFQIANPETDFMFMAKVRNESSFYLDNAENYDSSAVKEFLENHWKNYKIVFLSSDRIGYLRLNIFEHEERRVQSVGLDLAQEYRGKGLSVIIYKKIIKTLQNSNLPIVLWVLDFNDRAFHIYKKIGFREVSRSAFVQKGSNRNCARIMMEFNKIGL